MDTVQPRVVNSLTLAATPTAIPLSRALVRFSLNQWGFRGQVEDAELVASEIATNAVQAVAESEPDYFVNGMRPPSLIRVQVMLFESFMIIGVWDRSLRAPKLATATEADESGRGLVIVEELSTRWGWDTVHPYSGHKGKVVWAELSLPHAPVEPSGLPLRMPGRRAIEATVPTEHEVLVRVRDGLKRL